MSAALIARHESNEKSLSFIQPSSWKGWHAVIRVLFRIARVMWLAVLSQEQSQDEEVHR